ncbi:hypothetical protein K1719_005217 [Acacia pycnantha]|nr:hypothetical protein K1719_005217 [Acacia pycnantha]
MLQSVFSTSAFSTLWITHWIQAQTPTPIEFLLFREPFNLSLTAFSIGRGGYCLIHINNMNHLQCRL